MTILSTFQNAEAQDIQNSNFSDSRVWVSNESSYSVGRTYRAILNYNSFKIKCSGKYLPLGKSHEALCDLCGSSSIVKIVKFIKLGRAGDVDRINETSTAYKMLVMKPVGKSIRR
jgi:hypothetical protein